MNSTSISARRLVISALSPSDRSEKRLRKFFRTSSTQKFQSVREEKTRTKEFVFLLTKFFRCRFKKMKRFFEFLARSVRSCPVLSGLKCSNRTVFRPANCGVKQKVSGCPVRFEVHHHHQIKLFC